MSDTSLVPVSPRDWNESRARHLLNRAGFGVPAARVDRLARMEPAAAVGALLDYESAPRELTDPDFLLSPADVRARREAWRGLPDDEQRRLQNELQQEERQAIQRLKAWWIRRMAAGPRPLEEKMALFWHGHFATSAQKVRSSASTYQLNRLFRENATGNFKQLTMAVGQSHSMLAYLDNNKNVRGKPNENWARELMELFTLGQGQYTEADIKESARAFTGWTIRRDGFAFDESQHDFGPKTFLGRTGNFDGWGIVDTIFSQPAAAEFISAKLWRYFAGTGPSPELTRALAAVLRDNDYELKPLLRTMFSAQAFYARDVVGNQIKSPAQFVVRLAHDLHLETVPAAVMAQATAHLGQDLFYPPNVKGWDGGRAWINANTLLTRYNMPVGFVRAAAETPGRAGESMAGADMAPVKDPEKSVRGSMRERIESLPPAERAGVRKRMREAPTKEARRAVVMEVLRAGGGATAGWKPERLAEGIPYDSPESFVGELASRFLAVPMDSARVRVIAEALGQGPPDAGRLEAALHLLFSSAEYQLC